MRDFITQAAMDVYGKTGPGILTLVAIFLFFGVTATLAALEYRLPRYRRGAKRRPFHKNFSTIMDFLVFNPVMVVIAAYTTLRMQNLPDLLADKVLLQPQEVAAITSRFLGLLNARFLLPIAIAAAAIGWLAYLQSLYNTFDFKRLFRFTSLTSTYIAIATSTIIFIIMVFTYRVFVTVWFLGKITRKGFNFDKIEWTVAIEYVSRLLVGVNWFFIVLTSALVVFILHDFVFEERELYRPTFRIMVTLAFVATFSLSSILGPLFIIHENLLTAKIVETERLIEDRRGAAGQAREELGLKIEEVKGLRDWPLTGRESALPIVGQLAALSFTFFIKHNGEKIMRKMFPSKEKLVAGPGDVP